MLRSADIALGCLLAVVSACTVDPVPYVGRTCVDGACGPGTHCDPVTKTCKSEAAPPGLDGSIDTIVGEGSADLAPDQIAPDAAPPDGPAPGSCSTHFGPQTAALYTFEEGTGDTIVDLVGNNPGKIHGTQVTRVSGPQGCGQGLHFPESPQEQTGPAQDYVEIPDSPSWALAEGSLDLWVRFDSLAELRPSRGILSRDANNTEHGGHLSIARECDGAIVIRYQQPGASHHLCSEPVADEVWHHVGINFGPAGLELYVNGKRATRTDWTKTMASGACEDDLEASCGASIAGGIQGNQNPWVLGAGTFLSAEGMATPAYSQLGGSVDHLRISSARRQFAR